MTSWFDNDLILNLYLLEERSSIDHPPTNHARQLKCIEIPIHTQYTFQLTIISDRQFLSILNTPHAIGTTLITIYPKTVND